MRTLLSTAVATTVWVLFVTLFWVFMLFLFAVFCLCLYIDFGWWGVVGFGIVFSLAIWAWCGGFTALGEWIEDNRYRRTSHPLPVRHCEECGAKTLWCEKCRGKKPYSPPPPPPK